MDIGLIVGIAGIVLSIVAYAAAATAFPAAVVGSLACVLVAIFAWWAGSWRTAAVTLYFAVAAIFVSPALLSINLPYRWIAVLGAGGLLLGATLAINRFSAKNVKRADVLPR